MPAWIYFQEAPAERLKCPLQPLRVQTPEAIIVPHYEIGTLALDGWAVIFGTARRGLNGAVARPVYAP